LESERESERDRERELKEKQKERKTQRKRQSESEGENKRERGSVLDGVDATGGVGIVLEHQEILFTSLIKKFFMVQVLFIYKKWK